MSQLAAINRSDYKPLDFTQHQVDMLFDLNEDATQVTTISQIRRENKSATLLSLNGDKDMRLISVSVNGQTVTDYELTDDWLTLNFDYDNAELTIVTEIYPQNNTRLEGLYKSSSMYCTQCEAEGFRCITYFQDRPDNLATYNVRIEADKAMFPITLANGNLVDAGELDNGRHYTQWHDPFFKPSYLFACVAGKLEVVEDSFVTMSGREVLLQLYVEAKDLNKTAFAMACIKDAMLWDEKHYGREYDLDRFMVVAVDDFNMGAMENKGLNIFNTSCVLAHPDTTLDQQYERVDSIIAHEYFHNWSGNRVTCRDWFQLSLKEGFTVFRDGQYTATKGSHAVKRVEDARVIRGMQFAEDAGPMAHPIRPESYVEINNFYTLTVYEKGAEVIQMLHRLLGEENFRKGSDLYFDRFDGTAATCDDFVDSMQQASAVDLSQFRRWYSQAGTPLVNASYRYDDQRGVMVLTLTQSIDERFINDYEPLHIPLDVSWVTENEGVVVSALCELVQLEQCFEFEVANAAAVPVLNRGFTSPVKLSIDYSVQQLGWIAATETDGFSRWDALQRLWLLAVSDNNAEAVAAIAKAFQLILSSDEQPALCALLLTPPDLSLLMADIEKCDPIALDTDLRRVVASIATTCANEMTPLLEGLDSDPGDMSYEAIGIRSYRSVIERYLLDAGKLQSSAAVAMIEDGRNLSTRIQGLRLLSEISAEQFKECSRQFALRWADESLVLNHWLATVGRYRASDALNFIEEHLEHDLFELANPNKVRSLLAAVAANTVVFHAVDSSGYQFYAGVLLKLDRLNPQMAARLAAPLTRFAQFDDGTHQRMVRALQQLNQSELSKDLGEIVQKSVQSV